MEAFLQEIIQLVIRVGPVIVALVTMAETAVFLGLLVPAEATVLFAAFLAERGTFDLVDVLAATLLGATAGDHIGYWLGRTAGRGASARGGLVGRLWHKHELHAVALFRRRTIVAVTLSRFISFVRTLMPWFAGMSGMSYGRFAIFNLLGVLGWGIGSVAAGYLAGRSWELVAGVLGTFSTIIVIAIVLVVLILARRARRERLAAEQAATEPGVSA